MMLFLDVNGKVMDEFWNEGTNYKHVKYYYQDGEECKFKMIHENIFLPLHFKWKGIKSTLKFAVKKRTKLNI